MLGENNPDLVFIFHLPWYDLFSFGADFEEANHDRTHRTTAAGVGNARAGGYQSPHPAAYVLVRVEVYEKIRGKVRILLDDTVYTTAEMLDRVMAEDDAHDPYLAELQKKYGATP